MHTVTQYGEYGYLVTPTSAPVLEVYAAMSTLSDSRITNIVPGGTSILITTTTPYDLHFAVRLRDIAPRNSTDAAPASHTIAVTYSGPDLHALADELRISVEQLVALHQSAQYTVAFNGFAPGFSYLNGLPEALREIPRRLTPRSHVPAGTLALGGGYTAIYPRESPGGWHLLGHTSRAMFSLDTGPLLQPGHTVRFEATR